MTALAVGEIRLRHVTRSFRLRLEHNRTLKETVLRRRRTRSREICALRDVDLEVTPGTALGVVGANGAGKSTLLTVIAGILPPDRGSVEARGRIVPMLELGAGFHPDFTGRENVVLNASIHGLSRRQIEGRMEAIIAFSELEPFIDAPVRTYSSGMYTRLGFAVAASLDPDILLLDEVLAVGDEAFQRKCMGRIAEFRRSDATIVFVSHNAASVTAVCDRAIWLDHGDLRADGPPEEVIGRYRAAEMGDDDHHDAAAAEARLPARVAAVRLTDGVNATDRFLSGDPFAVEVEYEVREDVTPVVSVLVFTAEGNLLAAVDNRHEMEGADGPGARCTTFTLDALPLLEGRFLMTVALDPPEGGPSFHRRERCADFIVFSRARGFGPVAFPGRWSASVATQATGQR